MLHKKMKSSYDKNERKEMGNISQILKSHLEDKKIKDNPIIAKIIFPEKKVTYDIIGNSKTPKLVKINNKMSQSLLKKLTNLNEFKKSDLLSEIMELYVNSKSGSSDDVYEKYHLTQQASNSFLFLFVNKPRQLNR